jgi:deoxyribodipyrimidine photolyase-related protein
MVKSFVAEASSSSNYLRKMSDYSIGDWCDIFDALYYHFIHHHHEYLKKNYSTSRQVIIWNKKTDIEQKRLLNVAKSYLSKIVK